VDSSIQNETLQLLAKKHFEEQTKTINKELQEQLSDQFVYCISETNSNLLMWAHYADKHQGAVIEFKCIPEIDNVFLAAEKVEYRESFPTLGAKEDWKPILGRKNKIDPHKTYKELATTKSSHWSYEQEWRIFVPVKKDQGENYSSIRITPPEVSALYLGCKMPEVNRGNLVALVREQFPHCKILQSHVSIDNFSVYFEKLN